MREAEVRGDACVEKFWSSDGNVNNRDLSLVGYYWLIVTDVSEERN
jgi:hypothetical protein